MSYKTIYTEVEVDVDLEEFDDNELIEELESRGITNMRNPSDVKDLVEVIWLKRRNGNTDYQNELGQLIYQVLGYIV
jgi:hypothetical protein